MHASWRAVLGHRETWLFAFAKFLTDPVWWFYLYWTPKYLSSAYGVELSQVGVPLLAIYLCADVGSIAGGWWSGALIRRGYAVRRARMYVMLRCALAALLVISVVYVTDLWLAVLLVGLATAAHQAWSANLFASVADAIPERHLATVIGIGGTSGALGGMLVAQGVGRVLESTGSYTSVFIACSSMYLLVWLARSFCEARFTRCEK